MDFKRIQIIFLITFVIIDVFLFSLFHRNQSIQIENLNSGNQTSIVSEMRNDQISFDHRPSTRSGDGYYLAAKPSNDLHSKLSELSSNQNVHYANHRIMSQFKSPVSLNHKSPSKTLNRKLKNRKFVIHGGQYRYSYDLSTHNTLIYVQKAPRNAQHQPIFSKTGLIKFHVGDHKLTSYSQSYASRVRTLREKSNTVSSQRAITGLYQYNNIPNNTRIKWCRFAYTRLLSVKGNYIYIPTWVVAIKPSNAITTQYRYVNAFNGSIIISDNNKDLNNVSDNG